MSASANFRWTPRRERAAALLAADQRTDLEIAQELGVTDRQLRNWKADPTFAARVQALAAELAAAVRAEGIAHRQNRVAALNDRWTRMQRVLAARAQARADAPGGETGLLVRQVKLVKVYLSDEPATPAEPEAGATLISAKRTVEVVEYAVDVALLRELRATEEQAAKELGQWTEKREVSGDLLVRQYVGVDPDAV